MYLNDRSNGRMYPDCHFKRPQSFNGFLDFYFSLIQIKVILFFAASLISFPVTAPKTLPPSPIRTGIVSSTFFNSLAKTSASSDATCALWSAAAFFCFASFRFSDVPGTANLRASK